MSEAPFKLAPDLRFLFSSASHSAALAQVAYALQRCEPLVVITGEIGIGKTLLCRTVLQRIWRKTFLSVVNDPLLDRDDLLKQLLEDFGVISKDRSRLGTASRHELVETLQAFLRSLAPIQAHAVVIIDEAQHLQPDVLEQIRLLSNIDNEGGALLQIILVGQTDLEPLLSRPELRQLQQRVSRRFRLEPLSRDEVERYIKHRLALARDDKPSSDAPGAAELARALAEWAGVEFTPDAIHTVSRISGGLPRVINLLCDRSLEEACASRLRIITPALIESAARALRISADVAPSIAQAHADPIAPAALHIVEPAVLTGAPAGPDATARATDIGPALSFPAVMASKWGTADEAVETEDEALEHTGGVVEEADEGLEHVDEAALAWFSGQARPGAAPHLAKYLVLATTLALAAAAAFVGVRASRPQAAPTRAPTPAAASQTRGPGTPRDPATASGSYAAKPALPEATAPAPTTPATTASDGPFDIVVASFRTDARATVVAAAVEALGLPMRRRLSDGWQQIVTGPFASRTEAEDAQQRLHRAGLTGTQIVSTVR